MARFHSLEIADVVRETADAVSLRFRVPADLADDYRFRPGQHLTLRHMHAGEEIRRSYSLCDTDGLCVAVKKVAGGRFSTHANEVLKAGDRIDVMTPMGSFHPTPASGPRLHVAFAAGSGITPIIGIARSVLAEEPQSRFVLVYGNRSVDTILFHEALEDLKNAHMTRFAVHHVLSREAQDIDWLNGHIDAAKVEAMAGKLFPLNLVDAAWLCGPAGMIDTVSEALSRLGLPADRIHAERFSTDGAVPLTAPAPPPVARAGEARVSVIADGMRSSFAMPFDGSRILDTGLQAGLNLPFSCKGGVCCTCRAKVLEGKVEMAVNYALSPAEVEAGYVLTCQCRPLTERVVLDYDQV